MTDKRSVPSTEDQLITLTKLVGQQQILLYALHEYLTEQPFFVPSRFATIYEEFRIDLVAALRKRHPESSDDVWLTWLKDSEGPPH
jgi:hypothetical protein